MKSIYFWAVGIAMCAVALGYGCSSSKDKTPGQNAMVQDWSHAQPGGEDHPLPSDPEPAIEPFTHFAAGQLFEKYGNFAQAIHQYQMAIGLNPSFTAARNRLGLCYLKTGLSSEAEAQFREAVRLTPDMASIRNNMAFCLMVQKRWSEAERELRPVVQAHPQYERAMVNLGIVTAQQGKYDEALRYFTGVLGEPRAQYNMGLIYKSQARSADAVRAFERSILLEPRLVCSRFQLESMQKLNAHVSAGSSPVAAMIEPSTDVAESLPVESAGVDTGIDDAVPVALTGLPAEDLTVRCPLDVEHEPCEVEIFESNWADALQRTLPCTGDELVEQWFDAPRPHDSIRKEMADGNTAVDARILQEWNTLLGREWMELWRGWLDQRVWAQKIVTATELRVMLDRVQHDLRAFWERYRQQMAQMQTRPDVPTMRETEIGIQDVVMDRAWLDRMTGSVRDLHLNDMERYETLPQGSYLTSRADRRNND